MFVQAARAAYPTQHRKTRDYMQLSIRDASRFVIGAAIIEDMALASAPDSGITFEQVADAALREGIDGDDLRSSIDKLANQEEAWFRGTPPHTLSTERVMRTRQQEMQTLNDANLAGLATLAFGAEAAAGDDVARQTLHGSYQSAIRSIDQMPGSTADRRSLLQALKTEVGDAGGGDAVVNATFGAAQKTYLEQLMTERLAAYQSPNSPAPGHGGDAGPTHKDMP